MYVSITDEAILFLYACLAGCAIMFLYDIIFLAGKQTNISLLFINLCDTIFVLCACAITMFVIFYTGNGIVRGFEFLGVLCGGLVYKFLFSTVICTLLRKIIAIFTRFFKLFFKILLTPLQFTYKMIYKCTVVFTRPVLKVGKIGKRMVSHLCFRLKLLFRTVRNTKTKM